MYRFYAFLSPFWPFIIFLKVSAFLEISTAQSFQSCPTLCDPMDCSPPGSSVHGISQEEYWSWLPFPPPGDLPNPGIEPGSPPLQAGSLPLSHQGVVFSNKPISPLTLELNTPRKGLLRLPGQPTGLSRLQQSTKVS